MIHTFFIECEINGQWVDAGSAAHIEGAVSIANVAVKYYNVPTRILGEEDSIPLVHLSPGESKLIMSGGLGITLEEVRRISSTSGSLYETTEECVVLSMDDNTQAEFLYPGSIVLMLEYYPKVGSFGFYDSDADAKVLT